MNPTWVWHSKLQYPDQFSLVSVSIVISLNNSMKLQFAVSVWQLSHHWLLKPCFLYASFIPQYSVVRIRCAQKPNPCNLFCTLPFSWYKMKEEGWQQKARKNRMKNVDVYTRYTGTKTNTVQKTTRKAEWNHPTEWTDGENKELYKKQGEALSFFGWVVLICSNCRKMYWRTLNKQRESIYLKRLNFVIPR